MTPFDPAAYIRLVEAEGERVYIGPGLGGKGYSLTHTFEARGHSEEYCDACRQANEPQNIRALVAHLLNEPGTRDRVERQRGADLAAGGDTIMGVPIVGVVR